MRSFFIFISVFVVSIYATASVLVEGAYTTPILNKAVVVQLQEDGGIYYGRGTYESYQEGLELAKYTNELQTYSARVLFLLELVEVYDGLLSKCPPKPGEPIIAVSGSLRFYFYKEGKKYDLSNYLLACNASAIDEADVLIAKTLMSYINSTFDRYGLERPW